MTLRYRAPRVLSDVYVAAAGGSTDRTLASSATNRLTLDAAIDQIQEQTGEWTLFNDNGSQEVTVFLEDGTYTSTTGYALVGLINRGVKVVFSGNTVNPENVVLEKTVGAAGFFRVFSSEIKFEGVTFENSNGDGLGVFSGAIVEAANISFNDIFFDCIFVDDGGLFFLEGDIDFNEANAGPDSFIRCRERGTFININAFLHFNGNTWNFFDSIFDCITGFMHGPGISWDGAGSVTGDAWDQAFGGLITLGFETYSTLSLPGASIFLDRNQQPHVDKISIFNFNWGVNQTFADFTALNKFYAITPTANITVKFDFAVPPQGWNVFFFTKNPSFTMTFTDQADATITTIGGSNNPNWIHLYSDGGAWQYLDGGFVTAGVGTDEFVSVSANDTTPGYLTSKLVAGTNISLVENNDGGNETLTIGSAKSVFSYNEEVLAATKTLSNGDPYNQLLDGGVADRDVILPDPPTDEEGFLILNEGTTNNLLIKETGAGPVELTLLPSENVRVLYANASWRFLV